MHFSYAFSVVALTSCLAVLSAPVDTPPATGLSVGDPPRPRLASGYEEIIVPNKGVFKIRYTTIDDTVIPAVNFYPCLVKELANAGSRPPGAPVYPNIDCNKDGALWHIEDIDGKLSYAGLKLALRGLSATITKYEVPGIDFEIISQDVVQGRGRVTSSGTPGPSTNELTG